MQVMPISQGSFILSSSFPDCDQTSASLKSISVLPVLISILKFINVAEIWSSPHQPPFAFIFPRVYHIFIQLSSCLLRPQSKPSVTSVRTITIKANPVSVIELQHETISLARLLAWSYQLSLGKPSVHHQKHLALSDNRRYIFINFILVNDAMSICFQEVTEKMLSCKFTIA